LAGLYRAQGRYPEAEPLYQHVLEVRERVLGKDHPQTLMSVNNLATVYNDQGRYREAEQLLERALEKRERVLGKEHPDTLMSVSNLAALYTTQGRYYEAEPLFKRALEVRERVLGKEHPDTLASVNNLAELYNHQGRYGEAEPLYRCALEVRERVLGKDHPQTLMSVNNLAAFYDMQSRSGEVEPLLKRVLEGYKRVLGKDHPQTLISINNLALLCLDQGRYGEAEALFKGDLEASGRVLGKEHPQTLVIVNNLAELYEDQGRYGEAEPHLKLALAARERILGKEHPDTLTSISNLAGLYLSQGRYSEAEPLLKRALEASERVLGKKHPNTLMSFNSLAVLYFKQHDWGKAVQFWRHSTEAIAEREQRGVLDARTLTGKKKSESERFSWQFRSLIKAANRLVTKGREAEMAVARETFRTAQWAVSSEAARSLAQMAARAATGKSALAVLVRERQDLVTEWQKRDTLRDAAVGKAPEKRDAKADASNLARLAAIEARVAVIDRRLTAEFPDYADLASPAPANPEEVRSQLRPDEALVMFLDTPEGEPTPEETFIWVVTKTDLRWVRSDLGTAALTREVQALRCGLDAAAWKGQGCAELTGQTYTEMDEYAGKPLPFDLARAHALYKGLFGEVEDIIKGKQLLVVPSGPLTQLPFQVLVTAPTAANGDPRSAAWLIRDHALTVLPAVSSLKALRRVARPSAAKKPLIGFGNPLLKGPDERSATRAQLARDKQRCPEAALRRVTALAGVHRGIRPLVMRGGLADVSFIRDQEPLPETADELCAVARNLHADVSEIRLGARATEREAKALSASGKLAQYRIVHFATHGALSGEINGNSEPGLLMTPPDVASEEDDGYLTASEIAGLKLDSDWVILSACNTAAGGASGAEALSGLARAFFYAQARALLVSHWEVNSDTTVKLITGAMSRIAADKATGRAEAMRQSMLALIHTGTPQEAHPAFWGPFVVVGEGGVTAPVHSDKRKPGELYPASWATSITAGKSGAPH
jgi:CHAT domain-containing protein/tetratricopeptide (TPR) repeat protein